MRQALALGGVLDPGLEGLGHADVDPRDRALVAFARRARSDPVAQVRVLPVGLFLDSQIGRRWCHHELRLTPSESELDRAGGQLDRDLLRRGRQRVLDREPDGGVQRLGEASRELSRLLTARLSGGVELRVDVLDERFEFHGSGHVRRDRSLFEQVHVVRDQAR